MSTRIVADNAMYCVGGGCSSFVSDQVPAAARRSDLTIKSDPRFPLGLARDQSKGETPVERHEKKYKQA